MITFRVLARLAGHAWAASRCMPAATMALATGLLSCSLVASAVAATPASAATSAAPAAGSVIQNTARATYFDTDRGFNATLMSNTVGITVQAQEALTLTSDNSLQRAASGIASLAHRLSNTGNTPSRYALRYANRSDDDHDLVGLRLVWDRNGNGVADAGEPVIAGADSNLANFGPLAAGEFADFVLVGTVADGVPLGRVARMDLSARSILQGAQAANIDRVTVAEGALLQLVAAASNPNPKPGDVVKVTLTASNTGNRAASGLPVLVDGSVQSLLLLRNVIPANTTLAALGAANGALALYHLQGQPEHSYSRSPPADLRQVDAVAFGFASDVAPGQSLVRSVDMLVNRNANGSLSNTGQLMFMDGLQAQPQGVASNPVRMVVPEQPPTLRLFSDAANTHPATALSAGQPFYVTFDASRCNLDPLRIETQLITVSSTLAGDSESFLATETGPNSGAFRIDPSVPTQDAGHVPVVRGDGQLSVRANDQLMVSVSGCGAALMQASVLVDPYGVVFDSKTNVPLVGAVVTLIDLDGRGNGGQPGGLAHVFMADGLTRAPSVLTTGADGEYRFPLVAPSVYQLRVLPPGSYSFPSALAGNLLPADRTVDAGSYGQRFTITAETEPVHLDIPLDADPRAGFFIEKTSTRKTVELGEFVDYRIRIKNVSGQLLGRIRVSDQLPVGFAYLPGTARLDSGARLDQSALPEPEGGVGPALVFNVGSVADGAVLALTYRVRVGPGALQGDGINRAQARSAGPLPKLSNESQAAVQVLPGVFSNRGLVLGQVYADCNNNHERDPDEPGIAGVRLFLQDGSHVSTDSQGRYSLYGLRPVTHVLKLDRSSLPFSLAPASASQPALAPAGEPRLALLANRQAGDPGSRFIDMKNGELQRADFALQGCSDSVRSAIDARAEAAARSDMHTEAAREARLSIDPRLPSVPDPKSLPASGVVGGGVQGGAMGGAVGGGAAGAARPAKPAASNAAMPDAAPDGPPPATRPASNNPHPAAPGGAAFVVPPLSDEALAALDNTPAILSPLQAQVMGMTQTTVTVKGMLGRVLSLRVNGSLLPASRVGRLRSIAAQGLQVADYVGVDLQPGSNTLALVQSGADGVDGAADAAPDTASNNSHTITVTAPGALASLRLTVDNGALPADGQSTVQVRIEPLDAAGVPVTSPTPVTLHSARGRWLQADLDADEPGLQVFVTGGHLVLPLQAPAEPGDVRVQAASGNVRTQAKLNFVPELRPLIAAGLVDGVLNLRGLRRSAIQPARAQDGFEQALHKAADNTDHGVAARAALFLKGKVLGDALLTLAYDSDKASRDRLFRDIHPGEFYPVYGDESVPGFDAQSTSRLYLRLDRGRSWLLLGDFSTQAEAPAIAHSSLTGGVAAGALEERRLGQYSRSLNGLKSHLESDDGRHSLTAFASQTSSRAVVDELPALGTSGPYGLSRAPLVDNSEKVELLTRDRDQAALVLRRVPLTRFVDYEIEALTGRVLLKAPMPSLDAAFNPNTLRIAYEVEQGGPQSWVGGVSARVQATEQVVFSGSAVRDSDPQHPLGLQSVGATLQLSPNTAAAVELARTEAALVSANTTATASTGLAARLALRHQSERLQLQAQVVTADAGFANPSAGVAKAHRDSSVSASYRLADDATLKAELVRSTDLAPAAGGPSGGPSGGKLGLEFALSPGLRAELALRHSSNTVGAAVPASSASQAATSTATSAATDTATTSTTVQAKLTAQVPGDARTSVFVELEQDVANADRRAAAVGGERRLGQSTRLYGRYELLSSLGNRYGLNDAQQRSATVFGVQSEPVADSTVFSEYRLRDALDGRQAEAAMGLRNRWKLGGGWALSTGLERVHVLKRVGTSSSASSAESRSVTTGVDYTGDPSWKGAARLELRDSSSNSSVLGHLGLVVKLDDEWTALGRNLVTVNHARLGTRKTEDWLQVGLAYREGGARDSNAHNTAQRNTTLRDADALPLPLPAPADGTPVRSVNRRNLLLRAELRTEAVDDLLAPDSARVVAVLSAHLHQQPRPGLQLSGRVAAKWVREQSLGLDSRYTAQLLAARSTLDLNARWDIGLQTAALLGGGGRAQQWGLGSELGYLVATNLWFSLGWNWFGFTDRDLAAQDNTQRGAYLRLRFKFDEGLF